MQNPNTNSDSNFPSNTFAGARAVPRGMADGQFTPRAVPAMPAPTPLAMPAESFAEILQRARANKSVTISDVSRKTQISLSFINDIENSRFANLPDKDQCLSRLERLCIEYGIPDSTGILDNFILLYDDYHRRNGVQTEADSSAMAPAHPASNLSKGHAFSRTIHLPSLIIFAVVIGLLLLLGYAFYSYKMHTKPPQLDVDLSTHIPIYTPKPIYVDKPADRQ